MYVVEFFCCHVLSIEGRSQKYIQGSLPIRPVLLSSLSLPRRYLHLRPRLVPLGAGVNPSDDNNTTHSTTSSDSPVLYPAIQTRSSRLASSSSSLSLPRRPTHRLLHLKPLGTGVSPSANNSTNTNSQSTQQPRPVLQSSTLQARHD